jgi:hypothetical protein
MAAYNTAAYLDDAVGSILGQTFRNFEFIIVNNGSTDETPAILEKYRMRDSRIRLFYHEQQGSTPALNYGFRLARGRYIALMDSDDFSLCRRLERQLDYMERHSHVGILGAWVAQMDASGSVGRIWRPPANPKMAKWTNFFGVCVPCQSMLMRRDIAAQLDYFRADLGFAADVDFLLRGSAITDCANVPELLYRYRVWPGGTTRLHFQSVNEAHLRLLAEYINHFLKAEPVPEAVMGLRQTRIGPPITDRGQIQSTADLIQRLYHGFVRENDLSPLERREVSWDAAKRLAVLALQAARCSTMRSGPFFMRAMKVDYRLLYPPAFFKGVKKILVG